MSRALPPTSQESQRGVFIVFGAIVMAAIVATIALALDMYFIANAKLQQNNTAEYVALAVLRTYVEPPQNGAYNGYPSDEVSRYNFAIDRGSLLGSAQLLGADAGQISFGDLRVYNSKYDGTGGCEPGSIRQSEWCGFQPASDRGSVVFGYVDKSLLQNSQAGFYPIPPGGADYANAVKVTLKLTHSSSPIILPMAKLLLGEQKVQFNSTACALFDSPGNYQLLSPELCGAPGSAPNPTPTTAATITPLGIPAPTPTPVYTATPVFTATPIPTPTLTPVEPTPTTMATATATIVAMACEGYDVTITGKWNFGDPSMSIPEYADFYHYHLQAGDPNIPVGNTDPYPLLPCMESIINSMEATCGAGTGLGTLVTGNDRRSPYGQSKCYHQEIMFHLGQGRWYESQVSSLTEVYINQHIRIDGSCGAISNPTQPACQTILTVIGSGNDLPIGTPTPLPTATPSPEPAGCVGYNMGVSSFMSYGQPATSALMYIWYQDGSPPSCLLNTLYDIAEGCGITLPAGRQHDCYVSAFPTTNNCNVYSWDQVSAECLRDGLLNTYGQTATYDSATGSASFQIDLNCQVVPTNSIPGRMCSGIIVSGSSWAAPDLSPTPTPTPTSTPTESPTPIATATPTQPPTCLVPDSMCTSGTVVSDGQIVRTCRGRYLAARTSGAGYYWGGGGLTWAEAGEYIMLWYVWGDFYRCQNGTLVYQYTQENDPNITFVPPPSNYIPSNCTFNTGGNGMVLHGQWVESYFGNGICDPFNGRGWCVDGVMAWGLGSGPFPCLTPTPTPTP